MARGHARWSPHKQAQPFDWSAALSEKPTYTRNKQKWSSWTITSPIRDHRCWGRVGYTYDWTARCMVFELVWSSGSTGMWYNRLLRNRGHNNYSDWDVYFSIERKHVISAITDNRSISKYEQSPAKYSTAWDPSTQVSSKGSNESDVIAWVTRIKWLSPLSLTKFWFPRCSPVFSSFQTNHHLNHSVR